MARYGILLELGDIAIGQPGEIIEILVIFPDMIDAEMEILTLAHTPDRRTMRARLVATIPLAAGSAGLCFRSLLGRIRMLSKYLEFSVIESDYAD